MRAREPDQAGYVVRDGVRVYYEVHGTGAPTVLLMPTWAFVPSGYWKLQVPYLAHHYRVVTFDPRGNGLSDRPDNAKAYADWEYAQDALAVMDETKTASAVVAGLCPSVKWAVLFAVAHPDRVLGLVALAPGIPFLTPPHAHRVGLSFNDIRDAYEGWSKQNRHYWLRDYRGYVEWHTAELLPESHSSKLYDDVVDWSFQTRPETLILTVEAPGSLRDREDAEAVCRRLRCPVLVIYGDRDMCQPPSRAEQFAALTDAQLVVLKGVGHLPHARHPVVVNLLIRKFVDSLATLRPLNLAEESRNARTRA